MALISPGLQITVTDESQYVPTAVGTVPLVILATAQDKTANGVYATGTSAANAGKLQVFSSQRELVSALGYPTFQQSAAGTPLHGNELNEYGLMTSYSALGLTNRLYAIRANIDLNELVGTSVRPKGQVADGTYWLDLADTKWGIFEWNATTQSFNSQTPIVITSSADTTTTTFDSLTNEPTPLAKIGQVGSYAVVVTTSNNRTFYKTDSNALGTSAGGPGANAWTLVGSTAWQNSRPTVSSTSGAITTGAYITLNAQQIGPITGTTASAVATAINNYGSTSLPGVKAGVINGKLALYVTSAAKSNGSTVDGKLTISATSVGGATDAAEELGLTTGTYYAPGIQYSTYASVPNWLAADATARATGSVWFKTGALGGGSNFVFKKYNAVTGAWTTQTAQSYSTETAAIYGMDPSAGGSSIGLGAIYLNQDPNPVGITALGLAGFKALVRTVSGEVSATGNVPATSFVSGDTFTLQATQPAQNALVSRTVTVNGTTAADFVTAVLAANVPDVTARVESTGAITLIHLAGGDIILTPIAGKQDIPTVAGFPTAGNIPTNVRIQGSSRVITGFSSLSYTYSITTPYANPVTGTLWYNNDATLVDIMINDGTAWRGYQNVTSDARGYNLNATDPQGVIVSASTPTTQTDNSSLVPGDLWLDTSDLENWPALSRYTGTSWVAIDNTDQISQNGILFADARWDATGTTDPISGTETTVVAQLSSDYIDLDAPDARLYPRGTLLFNTRRSGYNVKRFVGDYFNADVFTVNAFDSEVSYDQGSKVLYGTTIYVATEAVDSGGETPDNLVGWDVLQTGSWVTASGNQDNGAMYAGHKAQRQIVIEALRSAIDSNTQIREDQFQFNLIVTPGYPEVISNMVALNNDRANTAFVIGDTPMSLAANAVDLTNWSNDATGNGLATNDPYLGVYYPSGLSNDVQGNTIMVPPSHMALRTYIHNDNVSYQWFAPAGTRRGLVDNATDIGYLDAATGEFVRTGINQGLRDSLYSININPITILTGIGLVVWGQKSRNPVTSAMDRVNVARLVNYIRTILANVGNGFLFEPNDKITRDQIKQIIEGAMNDLVAKRGIYDYLVVCDTSNNTPDRIARNELYVDIAIEPMKDVEFIYIPIRLMNPGTIGGLGK